MNETYKIQNIDINMLPISIAVYKAYEDDFIFVDFNEHAQKSDNISKEDLLGRKVTEVFPGVKEFGLFDVFQRVHQTKQNEKFELNFYKDHEREAWKINDVIANNDGTIMAIYQDKTKEVQKEQTMHSLGTLIDSSDNEYYTFDKETLAFTYCNHSAKKNLGYGFDEIQDLTPADIKPNLSKEDILDTLEPLQCGKKKQVVFQTQHQRKDGSQYDVEARVQLMQIHGEEQFIAIVLDITKRKLLEDSLETLGIIVNNSLNEVYIFDNQQLQFTYCNNAAQNNIGYTQDELVKITPAHIKPSYTIKSFRELLQPLIKGSTQMIVFETIHQRKDGSEYPVEARVQSMFIENKLCFVAIVMDISSRIEHEKKIKEQHNVLMAQSKMASMGEMLGNIAHQWRQPLMVISTIASGVKMSMDLNILDNKECKENLTKIVDVTKHLSNTIDDFRDYFKPDKSREIFTLEEVYFKMMSIVSPSLYRLDINIITSFEEVRVNGYCNEVVQCVLNIINNAKDALENVEHERYMFVDITKEKDFGYIIIKDNGAGISEEIIEDIFNPYFTTKHKSQGTGIGLYMTKQIITQHMQGEVFISNEIYEYKGAVCKGAQFTIKIPLYEEN